MNALIGIPVNASLTPSPFFRPSIPMEPEVKHILPPYEDLDTHSDAQATLALETRQGKRAVKIHERKVAKSLEGARKEKEAMEEVEALLPLVRKKLEKALRSRDMASGKGRRGKDRHEINLTFTSRISQEVLKKHLPLLLASAMAPAPPTFSSSSATSDMDLSPTYTRQSTSTTLAPTDSATSSNSELRYGKVSVSATFFEKMTPKVYMSPWFKAQCETSYAAAIAIVLVGSKLGLPIWDILSFGVLDLPRILLQRGSGLQRLKVCLERPEP